MQKKLASKHTQEVTRIGLTCLQFESLYSIPTQYETYLVNSYGRSYLLGQYARNVEHFRTPS